MMSLNELEARLVVLKKEKKNEEIRKLLPVLNEARRNEARRKAASTSTSRVPKTPEEKLLAAIFD